MDQEHIYLLKKENDLLKEQNEKYKKQIEILNQLNKKLDEELKKRKKQIDKHLLIDILDFLSNSNSLEKTAEYYSYDVEELYYNIPNWDGCTDRLQELDDYKKYFYEFEGRKNELDNIKYEINVKDYNKMIRIPDQLELDKIFLDYKTGKMSLYEIADKYNLLILNLFRLLKDNNLIENETDAIGYAQFYKDYNGKDWDYGCECECECDSGTDLYLLNMFYSCYDKGKLFEQEFDY